MINFIVVGKCGRIVPAVLQAIRGFTDAKCIVIGGPETAELRWSTLCKRQITMDLNGSDDENFADMVNVIASRWPHVVLIPADCDAIRLTNRVRSRLRLRITPIPKLATLDMFDDKWRFHQFCMRHGLSVPATRWVDSKAALDYDAIASDLGVPFVVKPLDRVGSTGVHIVSSKSDLEAAILHNDARIEAATGKIFLIESNPRFWASLTASVWCGLNFVAESIVPAARASEARRLTSGTAFTRHPLIRPSSWRRLVADSGERGRLLRAMTFDPPALSEFAREFPVTCWRFARKHAGPYFKGQGRIGAAARLAEKAV